MTVDCTASMPPDQVYQITSTPTSPEVLGGHDKGHDEDAAECLLSNWERWP